MQHGRMRKANGWKNHLLATQDGADAKVSASACTRPRPAYRFRTAIYSPAYPHARRLYADRAAADIVAQQALLRYPDFVVAMKGQYWQVRENRL